MNNPDNIRQRDCAIGYLLLRATLGMNIFLQGATRLAAGVSGFAGSLVPLFQKTFLPGWSVYAFGLTLPFAEALVGLLLVVGLRTRAALYGGMLLMFILTFGTGLRQEWQTAELQLVYAAVYAALLCTRHNDLYSLDWLIAGGKPL